MPTKLDLIDEKRRLGLKQEISEEEELLLNQGMPVQKIIGYIDFDDLKIEVKRNVLIPRYETQEVLEFSLQFINSNSRVLDLGCGSGYIGLTIFQKKGCQVVLSDYSDEAISQTLSNSRQFKDYHNFINIVKSDLFENVLGTFDVIVSNPPYIPDDAKLDSSVLNFEPSIALFGGEDGNNFYRSIISKAPLFLNKNGVLIFEISIDNVSFIESQGFNILNDINHKPRIAFKYY